MSTSLPPSGASPSPFDWRKQFLERRFHEYLAADQEDFRVAGVPLSPAEALQKCNPEKYDAALTDYARAEGEGALENACDRFPAPVAIPLFRALNSAENDHERLLRYKDTAEGLVLTLFAIALSECRLKGVKLDGVTYPHPNGNPDKFNQDKLLKDSVAFRLAMLEGILSALPGRTDLDCVQRIPIDGVRRLGELNDIRNDFVHYQTKFGVEATKICQEVREQLADAIVAFGWLAETELVVYAGTVTGKPGIGRLELCIGNGQNRAFTERTLTPATLSKCQSIPEAQLPRPFFHWSGQLCDASPFLYTTLTPKGHRRDVWVYKGRRSGKIELENVGEGEKDGFPDSPSAVELKVLKELFA